MTTDRRTALRRSRRRTLVAVYASATAAFALFAVWLGIAMAQGHDPAIGRPATAASAPVPERRVIVRRVVTTRRVHVVSAAPAPPSPSASAPAPASTPAPTPAPAPAPAPAPLVTSSS